MNFSQLHERLRVEVLRRIERQVITASLLARRAGLSQPLISNFLRSKRRLSFENLDRILAALDLSVAGLVPAVPASAPTGGIPLVTQHVAIFEDRIRPASVSEYLHLSKSLAAQLRAEHGVRRPTRERFVAIGITPAQAAPMEPFLHPNSVLMLDRHSNLPAQTQGHSVYAVLKNGRLLFAYVSYERNLLILRPHSPAFPLETIAVPANMTPSELVIGRVCAMSAVLPSGGKDG